MAITEKFPFPNISKRAQRVRRAVGGMSVRGARGRFHDFRLPNTPEVNRQHQATHHAEAKESSERDKYNEAMHRVHEVIDALSVVSTPKIETKIEVKKAIFPGHPWIARLAMARSRGVTRAEYGHGVANHFDHKPTYFTDGETTTGWAMNWVYEGDQIYPKRLTPNRNRDADLYIEKPKGPKPDHYRSWMGGTEAYDSRGAVDRYDLPRVVGTGDRLSTNKYGNQAIEGWTNPDKVEMGGNIDVEITKLNLISNYLIGLGQPLGIADHLDPALMPDAFQRPVPAARR